jgi:hypothetical protein
MKRRKSIKPPEYVAEHPPACCRKFMSDKVLKILDDINRQQADQQKPPPEICGE